jgi:hypothetical protein
MVDRQFLAARMVADTHRRLAQPLLARIPDTRSAAFVLTAKRPRPLGGRASEGVVRSESAPADSEHAHESGQRPRLGLSHPRIDDNHRSTI